MNFNKILIIGGSGVLGKELVKYCQINKINYYSPEHAVCNIEELDSIKDTIFKYSPNIIIHSAAFVDTIGCENNIEKAINLNIICTCNLIKCCTEEIKFVYISSEYVFSGDKGLYSIDDKLDPINIYGKTKAASEYIVSILKNHQIIRVPFIKKFHNEVFNNQYCSRYSFDEISDKIINNVLYNQEKIVHISTERKKLSQIYKEKNINFKEIPIPFNLEKIIPKDTSLINTNKF